jgi:hypothetical protein
MSKQMTIAVELIENLRKNLDSLEASAINKEPTFIFIDSLKNRLNEMGFNPTNFSIDDVVSNFSVDISNSTEKEVAEYLGVSLAEVVYDVYEKLGCDFEYWPLLIRNLSVKYDI